MLDQNEISLIIMAAGHGSRFGGPKQLMPVGTNGEFLMDYSIEYAIEQGIEEIVIVTNSSFETTLCNHLKKFDSRAQVTLKYQDIFTKEYDSTAVLYGTAIAMLAGAVGCSNSIIVLNADDYYGREGFESVIETLLNNTNVEACLAGCHIESTLSEFGSVSRAVCTSDVDNFLYDISEYHHIQKDLAGNISTSDGVLFSGKEPVSMNFWGFKQIFIDFVEEEFRHFVLSNVENHEFGIPDLVKQYIKLHKNSLLICPLNTSEWAGLTYPEDLDKVKTFLKGK